MSFFFKYFFCSICAMETLAYESWATCCSSLSLHELYWLSMSIIWWLWWKINFWWSLVACSWRYTFLQILIFRWILQITFSWNCNSYHSNKGFICLYTFKQINSRQLILFSILVSVVLYHIGHHTLNIAIIVLHHRWSYCKEVKIISAWSNTRSKHNYGNEGNSENITYFLQ